MINEINNFKGLHYVFNTMESLCVVMRGWAFFVLFYTSADISTRCSGYRVEARLEVILFWYKPPCVSLENVD